MAVGKRLKLVLYTISGCLMRMFERGKAPSSEA